jgi:hypothetical protein
MKTLLAAFLLCGGILFGQQAQEPLTDQRIINLLAAGVRPDEITRIINTAQEVSFVLRPTETDIMMKAGATEDVIRAMAAKESQGSAIAPIGRSAKLLASDAPIRSYAGKMRVFIDLSNDSWSLTGKGQGSTHPQTVEVMKTFGQSCPNLLVTNDPNKADYKVTFERESHKTMRRHNKFAAFDRNGDMVYSSSTRELGNAVRGFCASLQ